MNKYINGLRFDLAAKIIYVKLRLLDVDTQWYINLYKQHIKVFNGGIEVGNNKNTIKDFVNVFDKLIKEFNPNKTGKIPIGNNNILMNGAHRTTIAFMKKLKLNIELHKTPGPIHYDYNFFMNRKAYNMGNKNIEASLNRIYSDEMALEFCRSCPDLRTLILFPVAVNKNEQVKTIINNDASIIYALKININKNFLDNLIKELYRGESWIGGLSSSKFYNKSNACWDPNNNNIYVYLIKPNISTIDLKEKIRKLFNLKKHSVHINDTHEETIRIGSSLFNENSRHFLYNSNNNFIEDQLDLFQRYIYSLGNDYRLKENYCIVSSFILSLYGLRLANDIDYIYHKNSLPIQIKIGSHNKYKNLYTKSLDEIIYNPANHFYFNGIKCCSLKIIKEMKENRKEPKDIEDITLIDTIIDNKTDSNIFLTKN